jgi:hypothetical protein
MFDNASLVRFLGLQQAPPHHNDLSLAPLVHLTFDFNKGAVEVSFITILVPKVGNIIVKFTHRANGNKVPEPLVRGGE